MAYTGAQHRSSLRELLPEVLDSPALPAPGGALQADVFVHNPLEQPYSYQVPTSLRPFVEAGCRVQVPLGNRRVTGVVVAVGEGRPRPRGVPFLKPVHRVLETPAALTGEHLELGRWLSEYYLCSPGEAFQAMVPSYAPPCPPPRLILELPLEQALEEVGKRARRQQEVLELLAEAGEEGLPRPQLQRRKLGPAGKALLDRGLVRLEGREVPAVEPPPPGEPPEVEPAPALTPEQLGVHDAVKADMEAGRSRGHLVHGVTGSGKTEIYLALIQRALERGRGALFLVPEIALTVTMIAKVRARLGADLAVLHSGMGPRDRYMEWARLRTGAARVALGPRSAVFAPVRDLGLIVMDEEHEGSYKQQDKPRYHAREVALRRAEVGGFPVLLGSATPSLESYHRARQGELGYHRLEQRFRQDRMPPVTVVDMTQEFTLHRNRSIFSGELKAALEQTLDTGGQALLFMNRRGFHTHVFCRGCGFTLECESCSVSMTYHFSDRSCLCHHCGKRADPPRACPGCGSRAIRYAGTGTQRVAHEFALNYPGVEHARMDSDTTRRRGAHERILEGYSRGSTRVLIGTQMVTKGFDFPHLHLVGVVNADSGLTMPDFRGAERTFQTLTQVAGRVGRGEEEGRVVVQTYRPEHYALLAAREHDYEAFAAHEIPIREELFYPPFSRLVLVVSEGPDEEACRQTLETLRERLQEGLDPGRRVILLGPAPAPLMRLDGRHRYHLILKVEDRPETLEDLKVRLRELTSGQAGLKLDVDPLDLL